MSYHCNVKAICQKLDNELLIYPIIKELMKKSQSRSKSKGKSQQRKKSLKKPVPPSPQRVVVATQQQSGLFSQSPSMVPAPRQVQQRVVLSGLFPCPPIWNDDEPIDFKEPAKPDQLKQQLKASVDYDTEKNVSLYLKCRFTEFSVAKEAQLIPATVNIKTQALSQDVKRPPIDLICVLDRSGSMGGEKIKLLRETLKFLLEELDQGDRICLINFDDRTERMCPLLRCSPENKVKLLPVVQSLRERGGTKISLGMVSAFKAINDRKQRNCVTSIFLLTDGQDGSAVVQTEKAMAKADIKQPFTIHCFGFGSDHDGNLMTKISDLKDGSFFYIEKIDTVDEAFATALGSLMSVVAQEIVIYMRNCCTGLFKDLQVGKTYGQPWQKTGVTNGLRTNLIQLSAGKQKGFVFDLIIPELKLEKPQKILALEAEITFADRERKRTFTKQAQLFLTLHPEGAIAEPVEDGEVMENYFRMAGADAINDAVQLADAGNFEEGKKRLEVMVQNIKKNKNVNQAKMETLVQQIVVSKESCNPSVYAHSKNQMLFANKAMKCQKPMTKAGGEADLSSMNMQEVKMYSKALSKKCK